MRKVFIPKDNGHDYSKAEKWGELIFLCKKDQSPFDVGLVKTIIEKKLQELANEGDIILASGPPVFNQIIGLVWPFKTISFLIYNSIDEEYINQGLVL